MKNSYLMGVDIGVSFVKAGIYDTEGNCVTTATEKTPGEHPESGVFIQEGDDLLHATITTMKKAVEQADVDTSGVEAIAFSGQMAGAIGVDENWNAVTTWSNPLDTRCTPYLTQMLETEGEQILKLSGTNVPFFTPKILWWKNDFPEQYKRVKKFMVLCGFIIGKLGDLSPEDAFVDRTYLELSGIADIPNNRWSPELCEKFGIDQALLPRIVDSNTVVAKLSKQAANACGLKEGIPLVAGAGDKPAGSVGAGIVTPGLLIDECASFAAISLCVDEYAADLKYRSLDIMPSPIPGQYYVWVYLFGSGVTHAWFKDTFGEAEQRLASESGKSAFALLDEQARHVPPGSDGLLALGLLAGRALPIDPDIRGMWLGHTWSHKKEHFYRALLESFAYEYGYFFKVMKNTYPDLDLSEVRVIGGGSRSDLWNQIKSDVMGIPYVKVNRDDCTILGDALIAGNAVGIYPDLKQIAQKFTQKTKEYTPDAHRHEYYQRYAEVYESVFDKVRDVFVDLKNIPRFTEPESLQ